MMGQKKLEIFLVKIRKLLGKQFLEVAYRECVLFVELGIYQHVLFNNNAKS